MTNNARNLKHFDRGSRYLFMNFDKSNDWDFFYFIHIVIVNEIKGHVK